MATQFTHGHAVIVGVGADLPTTLDDAKALAALLTDPARCAYPETQVRLLIGPDAQRDNVLAALDWLADATRQDPQATAIVYFSGHGADAPDFRLIPYGYRLSDLPATTISGAEFTEKLRAVQAARLVVLLDCCHAGGQADPKAFPLPKAPLPPAILDELGRSSGRVILASSRKDELSWSGQPYSVFTAALLQALAGAGAAEPDGYARVLDLALYLGRMVPNRTQDRQHPIIKVANLADNFALAYYAGGDSRPKPLDGLPQADVFTPLPASAQVEHWQRMLANRREALLYIEERMSQYIEQVTIPMQYVKEKRDTERQIADLERKLGIPQP